MLITNKNTTQPGVQKRTFQRSVKIGPVSFKFVTLLLVGALILFYIAAAEARAAKSYTVYTLNTEVAELEKENEWLQAEATRLKTLQKADQIASELQMEPVKQSDVSYDASTGPSQ